MTITIPDVSFYQTVRDERGKVVTPIDFAKLRAASPAVIIRAGQGSWTDVALADSWRAAKNAGLARGSYWYYDNRIAPKAQADRWIDVLGGDLGELGLWCDFEDSIAGAYMGWRRWYDFIERVKALAPTATVGIYTGYYYWTDNTRDANAAQLGYFKQYPLWIANYKTNAPMIPRPFETWTMWQYTDKGDGTKYGVQSLNIDLNYCRLDIPTVAPSDKIELKTEQTMTKKYKYNITPKNVGGMKIRAYHDVTTSVIGTLAYQSVGEGDVIWTAAVAANDNWVGDQWLLVENIAPSKSVNGWVAIRHQGIDYCTLAQNADTPPLPPTLTPPANARRLASITMTYSDGATETYNVEAG